MVPEPEFGERLTRLLLGGPAADCPLLAPALREPAAAARIDAVTGLGEPFSVVARGAGRVEATFARTRYGVFYSRNTDGLADRVEIYRLQPVRSAPRLLRGPVFRGVLLAVPVYLAVVIALSPSTIARVVCTTRLFLCHLAEGSVTVTEGQVVSAGDVVGHVGNSGRSTEPHLHLHAVGADGAAVPLLIEGNSPWRGSLLLRR